MSPVLADERSPCRADVRAAGARCPRWLADCPGTTNRVEPDALHLPLTIISSSPFPPFNSSPPMSSAFRVSLAARAAAPRAFARSSAPARLRRAIADVPPASPGGPKASNSPCVLPSCLLCMPPIVEGWNAMRKESDQIVVSDEGCLPAALVSRRAAPPSPGLALAPATNEAAPWCQTHRLTTASRPLSSNFSIQVLLWGWSSRSCR